MKFDIVGQVRDGSCMKCGKPAQVIVEVDRDEEGVTVEHLCTGCHSDAMRTHKMWLGAFDTPDRPAQPNHIFLVKATGPDGQTNHWRGESYRKAISKMRSFPGSGGAILEVTPIEARRLVQASLGKK